MNVIAIKIEDRTFGVDVEDVDKLLDYDEHFNVIKPLKDDFKEIIGFIHLKEGLIPVLDTNTFFQIKKETKHKILLIINTEKIKIAIPINNIMEIIDNKKETAEKNNALFKRFDIINDQVYPIVNPEGILQKIRK